MLKEMLESEIEAWRQMGIPCLLQRFVLRNGRPYETRRRIGRKQQPKNCYGNATEYVARNGGVYVEGYCLNRALAVMPIHHAWVEIDGKAMDPTLDASKYEYFGVAFDFETVRIEVLRTKVYGILDPGLGLNSDLMFRLDPGLKTVVDRILAKRTRIPPSHKALENLGDQS